MNRIAAWLWAKTSSWWAAPMSPEREAEFARTCRERILRIGDVFAISTLVCAIAWWPIDYLVFAHLPDHVAPTRLWRLGLVGLTITYLVLARIPAVRRHETLLFAASFCVVATMVGYCTCLAGGPEKPYFNLLYVLGFGTVPVPLPLSRRVPLTVAICASIFAGAILEAPANVHAPHLPMAVSSYVWITLISVTFGQVQFLVLRANFSQAALLAESNAHLEARVAERTVELRDLLDRLETTREEERSRIARELHDQLGQELTAQRLTLAIAEECLDGEPSTARAKLVEMRRLLDGMTGSVRALIGDLRPWILHDLGLGEAARWLARRTEELAGIHCELSVVGDATAIGPERSAAVFRILQESLHNVTKHAHATRVAIGLDTTTERLVVNVTDDGVGLGEPTERRGFGLLGMRERAHALGGELSVRGLDRGGTEVICTLPLGSAKGNST